MDKNNVVSAEIVRQITRMVVEDFAGKPSSTPKTSGTV